MPTSLDLDAVIGLPSNTGGMRVLVDSNTTVDNIFIVTDGTEKFRIQPYAIGTYHPSWVLNSTGDKTARLQAIVNHIEINTIVIDKEFIVNGTLTIPAGKTLKFEKGGKITGIGILGGGFAIDAGNQLEILGTSIKFAKVLSARGYFSAKWWGAKGDRSTDDTVSLQAAFNCIVRSYHNDGCVDLFIPKGIYVTSNGLVLYFDPVENPTETSPAFIRARIYGEGCPYADKDFADTVIRPTHNDNFGIAIQNGKGVEVFNLAFDGQNNIVTLTQQQMWLGNRADFVTNGCRTNTFSPYSGIVIDPFSSTNVNNRYPRMNSYYVYGGISGSTDIRVYNVSIYRFVCGFCINPSGHVKNSECITLRNTWFGFCRDAYANCQSQGRENVVENMKVWSAVHTIFICNEYGEGNGVLPHVRDMNIAGGVHQLFRILGGWSYGFFENVYSENMYRIGTGAAGLIVSFHQCNFNFDATGGSTPGLSNNLLNGGSYSFKDCIVHLYDEADPTPLSFDVSSCLFDNCTIDGFIINQGVLDSAHSKMALSFDNCTSDSLSADRITTGAIITNQPFSTTPLILKYLITRGSVIEKHNSNLKTYRKQVEGIDLFRAAFVEGGRTVNFVNSTGAPTVEFVSGDASRYKLGDQLMLYVISGFVDQATGQNINAVSAGFIYNITGSTVKCKQAAAWNNSLTTVNGALIACLQDVRYVPSIIGESTSGSAVVTNCIMEEGNLSLYAVGSYLKADGGSGLSRIVSIVGTTITLSDPVSETNNRCILSPYQWDQVHLTRFDPTDVNFNLNDPLAGDRIIKKGDIFKNIGTQSNTKEWICTVSGIFNSSKPPTIVSNDFSALGLYTGDSDLL